MQVRYVAALDHHLAVRRENLLVCDLNACSRLTSRQEVLDHQYPAGRAIAPAARSVHGSSSARR